MSKSALTIIVALSILAISIAGVSLYLTRVEDTPPCDQGCQVQFIQLRDAKHAHYETSRHLAAVLKQTQSEIAFYKKKAYTCLAKLRVSRNRGDGKPCGAGLEATLASFKRLLLIGGSSTDGPHMDLLINTFRLTCREAESMRVLKALP